MTRRLSRYGLSMSIAAALLAGCGVLQQAQDQMQPPIGMPGAIPQSRTIVEHAGRGRSWMLPEARSSDLLYIADDAGGEVLAFSYPRGKLLGTLTGFKYPNGLCSDQRGNVFVANFQGEDIPEYAHGGTVPIATLDDYGYFPRGCSVDPTTGNLAVTNYATVIQEQGNVEIYPDASGRPATYVDPSIYNYWFCGYDDQGDLFVDGTNASGEFVFSELRAGASEFSDLTINEPVGNPGAIQWDGAYIALTSTHGFQKRTEAVYQLEISSSGVTVAGTTTLLLPRGNFWGQSWIDGHRIIQSEPFRSAHFWGYPKGGNPMKTLHKVRGNELFGVTVSVAQSR